MNELNLLLEKAAAGDAEAENLLIGKLRPSVRIVASSMQKDKEFQHLPLDQDDMEQEGLIALPRAIRNFNPEKGILFWTYAEAAVRNAITDYVRKIQAERLALGEMISLDADHDDSDEEKDGRAFEETLSNDYVKTPEQIYPEKERLEEIHSALRHLSGRERDYLCYRFGFDDDEFHDREETAHHFYLSTSRAKKLEASALDNFKLELPWWY